MKRSTKKHSPVLVFAVLIAKLRASSLPAT